jgi:hypothetical protein
MMDEATRRQQIMTYEGHVLSETSRGACYGADNARCLIDGAFNALIRIDGREAAALFAFAVSDRIAGGLRQPTAWPLPPGAQPAPESVAPSPPPEPPEREGWMAALRGRLWLPASFWCGFVAGAWLAGRPV